MNSENRIIKARAKLMKGNIGMASMLLNLELIEANERCDTMATDGINIYWNDEFVKTLTDAEIQAVLVHEASHVIWEHPLRKAKRNHEVWNIATDYVINAWISYDLRMELPKDGLLDRQYQGQSAEAVYRTLMNDDEALQDAIDEMKSKSDDSDSDESESGEGDSQNDDGDSDSDEGKEGESQNGNGSGKSLLDELADMKPSSGEVWMPKDEEGNPLSENAMAEIQEKIQRHILMANKLEGCSEGGTSTMNGAVQKLNETYVDWVDVMRDLLTSAISNNPTWSRLNKRHSWRGVNLPSKDKEPQGGEIVIAIDTSCSVSQQELNIFATETQSLCEECGINKVRVTYCDTTIIRNPNTGEWWDEFDLDNEELVFNLRGGGGTRFEPPFNLFNDETDDTDDVIAFVYFTDGYCDVSADVEPSVPVIWGLSRPQSRYYEYPFGEVVEINMENL
jgi:predicted metal-dependent peptidase|tara:strand:- start:449 stop:1798 length:1350 start_codon:yes stop_codon:yes gene_type:complete